MNNKPYNFCYRGTKKVRVADFGKVVIFCRSELVAFRLYKSFFNINFNPNNTKKGYVTCDGLLVLNFKHRTFKVVDFWTLYGFYPILILNTFFNKRKYNRLISNACKFINDL